MKRTELETVAAMTADDMVTAVRKKNRRKAASLLQTWLGFHVLCALHRAGFDQEEIECLTTPLD